MKKTIAILAAGQMGAGIGRALVDAGAEVLTSLQGRSERTRQRAQDAGMVDVPDDAELLARADLVLSILPPRDAAALARRLLATGALDVCFVECNAIAPETTRAIEADVVAAGWTFVDASIVGGPPRDDYQPRIYASGAHTDRLSPLSACGLDVRPISERVGDASALKMCYGGLTKGMGALASQLLVAAHAMGVFEPLRQEFESSQSELYPRLARAVPRIPLKAGRWVGEMEEVSKAFAAVGLDPTLYAGAAHQYTFLAENSGKYLDPDLGFEDRTLLEILEILASAAEPQT